MRVELYPPKGKWEKLLQRPVQKFGKIEAIVEPILKKVSKKGDKALRKFALEYDHVALSNLQVSEQEINQAASQLSSSLKEAIAVAIQNIEKFHRAQQDQLLTVETMPGVVCMRKSVPISKVGLYIPGGTAPLFSTVLMLGIPANIAGCKEIVLCTPSDSKGKVNPAILYAAQQVGIRKIFRVGGAQAIAAMAYGTESIPKVSKIFGPGNQYVTVAKQIVSKQGVAIDMPAGPSEVAVLADETAIPAFVASDLLSQAEHGVDSQVILVTTDKSIVTKVEEEIEKQLKQLPRQEIATAALSNSLSIVVKDLEEAYELLNEYGPEHLIIATKQPTDAMSMVINAGSVFLGHFTPESAGDYASGTNHTLPTNGYANAYSGVSLDSFLKKITYQEISEDGLRKLGPVVEEMAAAEELVAHKRAISLRLQYIKEGNGKREIPAGNRGNRR